MSMDSNVQRPSLPRSMGAAALFSFGGVLLTALGLSIVSSPGVGGVLVWGVSIAVPAAVLVGAIGGAIAYLMRLNVWADAVADPNVGTTFRLPSVGLRAAGALAGYSVNLLPVLAKAGGLWTSAFWPAAATIGVAFTWRLARWSGKRRSVGFAFLGGLVGLALFALAALGLSFLSAPRAGLTWWIGEVCAVLGGFIGYRASQPQRNSA